MWAAHHARMIVSKMFSLLQRFNFCRRKFGCFTDLCDWQTKMSRQYVIWALKHFYVQEKSGLYGCGSLTEGEERRFINNLISSWISLYNKDKKHAETSWYLWKCSDGRRNLPVLLRTHPRWKTCIGFSITETMMNSKKGEYHDFFRIPEVLYLPQG